MKKRRNILTIFFSLLSIPFTSSYGGSYSTFSINQFISIENILAGILFFIILFISMKGLRKIFPRSQAAAIIMSMLISIMSIYGLKMSNFSIEDFLYSIGINEYLLETVGPWILLVFALILLWKLGFSALLMIFGGIFILLGFLGMASEEIIYNWEFALGLGIALFLLGVIIWKKLHKKIPGIKIPGIKGPGIKNPLKGGRLALVIEGRRITYPSFTRNAMTIPPGKKAKISVENIGSRPFTWKMITKHGLRASNTRGIMNPRNSLEVGIASNLLNKTKSFMVIARGRFGKASRQKIKVIVYPGRQVPPPKDPKIKDPVDPKEKRKMGEASLDVIVGGRSIGNSGSTTLDLTSSNTATITIKNGGTGGTLGWRGSSNHELKISRSHGKLSKGQTHTITVTVNNRTGRTNPAVIINGRGGGRLGGRATRGRVLIYFKVK